MALAPELGLTGMLLFAGASFFFAMAESALFSLGKWRAQQLAERSPGPGRRVADLLGEPQDLLAAIVLGNTLANAGLITIALGLALQGQWPLWPALLGTLLLILLGCEVIPKTLAVRAAEQWSLRVAGAMQVLLRLTRWPRRLAQQLNAAALRAVIPNSWKPQTTLSDEEYQELIELAYQQGTLGLSEKEIILQIIALDRRTVKDAMKPRSRMACLSDDLSVEDMLAAARQLKHRRLPLYDETPDTIVGVLNTRVFLLDPNHSLEEATEFPSFVPGTMNLLQLFRSFQRQGRGLAIVLDEFGGTAGLITMEDILEEVVGEIRAESEAPGPVVEKLGNGRWRVSGAVPLVEFRREFRGVPPVPSVETMGGWLVHELGVVPAQGESAIASGLRLTALAVDERRVRELLVEALQTRRGTGERGRPETLSN